ncbi:MAG: hypothetical protein ABI852_03285 [Gemmatimonadaceae bacterium]
MPLRWKWFSTAVFCSVITLTAGCADQVQSPMPHTADNPIALPQPESAVKWRAGKVLMGAEADSVLRATAELWLSNGDSSLMKTLQQPEWMHVLKKPESSQPVVLSDEAPITESEMNGLIADYLAFAAYPSVSTSSTTATFGANGNLSAQTTMTMIGTHGKNDSRVDLDGFVHQSINLSEEGPATVCPAPTAGTVSGQTIKAFFACIGIGGTKTFTSAMTPSTLPSVCGITAKTQGQHTAKAWVAGLSVTVGVPPAEVTVVVSPGGYVSSSVKPDFEANVAPQPACPSPAGLALAVTATTQPGPQIWTFAATLTNASDSPYTWKWTVDGAVAAGVTSQLTQVFNPGPHSIIVEVKNKYNLTSALSYPFTVPNLDEEVQYYECNGVFQLTPEGCEGEGGGGGGGGGSGPPCTAVWLVQIEDWSEVLQQWVPRSSWYENRPC